jgi:hypothetical protein
MGLFIFTSNFVNSFFILRSVIIPASIPPSPQKVKTGAVNGNIPAKAIAAQAPPASPTLAPAWLSLNSLVFFMLSKGFEYSDIDYSPNQDADITTQLSGIVYILVIIHAIAKSEGKMLTLG